VTTRKAPHTYTQRRNARRDDTADPAHSYICIVLTTVSTKKHRVNADRVATTSSFLPWTLQTLWVFTYPSPDSQDKLQLQVRCVVSFARTTAVGYVGETHQVKSLPPKIQRTQGQMNVCKLRWRR